MTSKYVYYADVFSPPSPHYKHLTSPHLENRQSATEKYSFHQQQLITNHIFYSFSLVYRYKVNGKNSVN